MAIFIRTTRIAGKSPVLVQRVRTTQLMQ